MATREDWMRRLGPLYGGAVALVSSTSWRWPDVVGSEDRSGGWVVALALPIGAVAWLAAAIVRGLGIAPVVGAFVGLAVLSLASAALVERGVVDRVDRRYGGREDARAPGLAAILVVVFGTLTRAGAIASVAPAHWLGVFVATALVGRWAAVFLQSIGDPILDDVSPRSLVATPLPPWLLAGVSAGVAVITVLALGGRHGLVALAVTALLAFALGVDAQRRDRGLSAPVVAVAAAIGELVVLLTASAT